MSDPLSLELEVIVSHLITGTQLGSLARTEHCSHHLASTISLSRLGSSTSEEHWEEGQTSGSVTACLVLEH